MPKVLIVEADRIRSSFMRDVFSEEGCKVDCAFCGFETYYFCHRERYNIIIINFNLPDLDGKKIAANLLKKDRDSLYIMISDKKKLYQKMFCKKNKIELLENTINKDQLLSIIYEYRTLKNHEL